MSHGDRTTAGVEHGTDDVMELLADHVPLALLVDLVTPEGPASDEILRAEGMPQDAWWEADDDADQAPSVGGRAGSVPGHGTEGGAAADRA